jgi:hypothetical protein
MNKDQELAGQIKRDVSAVWRMQQHGPRLIRMHPNDVARIRHDEEYDAKVVPPTIAGCPIEVTDEVAEGSPEVVER